MREKMNDEAGNGECLVCNGRLVTPFEEIERGSLWLRGGKIEKVWREGEPAEGGPPGDVRRLDAAGRHVIPGMIDTHVGGMLGCDCREGREAFETIATGMPRYGVTSFLPLVYEMVPSNAVALVGDAKDVADSEGKKAEILGVHVEGPYFSEKYRGALRKEALAEPSIERDRVLYETYPGFVKLLTMSSEVPGGLEYIRYLVSVGVTVSLGHTEVGEWDELKQAVDAGARSVTHIFDAMQVRRLKELGVDSPGFADLALIEDRLFVSLIADGVHVCPELINLLVRAKAHDKIVLATDCFIGTGMPNGIYTYPNGMKVRVDGTCHRRVTDNGLVGSVLTLDRAVKNMLAFTGLSLTDVLPMATINPARLIGVDDRKGSLEEGKDADVAIVDDDGRVVTTLVAGRVVYDSE